MTVLYQKMLLNPKNQSEGRSLRRILEKKQSKWLKFQYQKLLKGQIDLKSECFINRFCHGNKDMERRVKHLKRIYQTLFAKSMPWPKKKKNVASKLGCNELWPRLKKSSILLQFFNQAQISPTLQTKAVIMPQAFKFFYTHPIKQKMGEQNISNSILPV